MLSFPGWDGYNQTASKSGFVVCSTFKEWKWEQQDTHTHWGYRRGCQQDLIPTFLAPRLAACDCPWAEKSAWLAKSPIMQLLFSGFKMVCISSTTKPYFSWNIGSRLFLASPRFKRPISYDTREFLKRYRVWHDGALGGSVEALVFFGHVDQTLQTTPQFDHFNDTSCLDGKPFFEPMLDMV